MSFALKLILAIFLLFSISKAFRPPAVPLIVQDPYISIWSMADNLYDDWPKHWAGGVSALVGMIYIDNQCYTFMGPLDKSGNVCPTKIQQTNLVVNPTSTIYTFQGSGVQLIVNFTTPSILNDLSYLVLPGSYITFVVTSLDQQPHSVALYYDNSGEVAVNTADEEVTWTQQTSGALTTLSIGTSSQQFNGDKNSDRIDWGYWYVSVLTDPSTTTTVASDVSSRGNFAKGQSLPPFDSNMPRPCQQDWPVLAVKFDLGKIQPKNQYIKYIGISYDEVNSMEYFGTLMKPYWTRFYNSIADFQSFFMDPTNYENFRSTCTYFDSTIQGDMMKVVTSATAQTQYSTLGGLAYRQVTGAMAIVWNSAINDWWVFMKEISSDGDVSTVDVIYPASPLILYLNPQVYAKLLVPILVYGNNETNAYGQGVNYNLAWAPHHLGTWPVSYIKPDQQEQMPIEETGNLMHLINFVVEAGQFSAYTHYWSLLRIWGEYLISSLPDPGDQLCTDDFEGPSPHNANLAAKGIVGLGSWSALLKIHGDTAESASVLQIAQNYAQYWKTNAIDNDHYKLEYDKSNTWSLKYNLLFQYVLGLSVFSDDVAQTELKYYFANHLNNYGVPLDNRATFTKLDWEFWMTAMGSEEQFDAMVLAVYNFANDSTSRVPLTDWYDTINPVQKGFQARPVVGGIWSRVLLKQQQELAMKKNVVKAKQFLNE